MRENWVFVDFGVVMVNSTSLLFLIFVELGILAEMKLHFVCKSVLFSGKIYVF